jgi:hypothetical protein
MVSRFLLDNDGTNFFVQALTEDVQGSVAAAIAACPSEVSTYLLCPNGCGRFYHPTSVGEVYPPARLLEGLYARGVDPFGIFIQQLRQAGKETGITYRMNDVHGASDEAHPGTATFKRQHPELVVDPAAAASGEGGWMAHCLDYSRPAVQEYILGSLGELIGMYQLDVLQLDWLRFPRHLSGGAEEVWAKRDSLTQFTARVRQLLRSAQPDALLAARIPTTLAGCRHLGVDLGAWTASGMVDYVVATPFLTTDFDMPLEELRGAMGPAPVPLYADIEFGHGTQIHCPESLRAAAAGLFGSGADGIYLFNFPCWTEYLGARPYDWVSDLASAQSCRRKPLLFSVSHSRHRVPGIDQTGQLPVTLNVGGKLRLELVVPEAALPTARASLLVHSCGDLTLKVNGMDAVECPLLRRAELFVEYIPQDEPGQVTRPRHHDCRFFELDPAALQGGANRLELFSTALKDLEIQRLNLGLW